MKHELTYAEVRPEIDLPDLPDEAHVNGDHALLGQERAERALRFGMNVGGHGFNVFVAGPTGIGKMELVEEYVREVAAERDVPADLLFVHNHDDPYRPRLISLPAGKGRSFADEMGEVRRFLEEELPGVFESDEYAERRDEAVEEFKTQGEDASDKIQAKAEEYGFTMKQTLMGTALVPTREGKPLSNEEMQQLPEEEQADIQRRKEELEEEIASTQKRYRKLNREAQERVKDLDRTIVGSRLEGPLSDLRDEYSEYEGVSDYLDALKEDVQNNVDALKSKNADSQQIPPQLQQQLQARQQQFFSRFDVNVVVDNARANGAPVVVERNPTYTNLVGTIEKEMRMGALTTDFTMVKAGSILTANGGFLLLPLEELLRNAYGWDALKRTLDSGELQVEELQQQLGLMSVKTLKPQPVPVRTRVVLVGDPTLFALLQRYDKGFRELFKVRADLETRMDATPANTGRLATALRSFATREALGTVSDDALGRLLQHASRDAGHRERLSVRMESLHDVLRETAFWAHQDGNGLISADHVDRALDERIYRSGMIRDRLLELVEDGTILIRTRERATGQVNGLSVIAAGEIAFGRPMRITATVGPGRDGVVDIERKTELGGPLHNKGVLIITGYLSRLAGDRPIGMSAHLVFEQSYAQVEGDSASLGELLALVSALADEPMRQDVAITGSVNQYGEVQAIGGVNEKVEGFYDLCSVTELSGDQGVVIPEANAQNLMLRRDVARAVEDGAFHLWTASTVDEAMEILGTRSMEEVAEAARARVDALNEAMRALGAADSVNRE